MRVFKNESLWDKETQDWVEYFFVDSLMVSSDEFYEQVACEELATEEEPLVIQCDCDDCVEQRRLEQEEQECSTCEYDCTQCEGCGDPEDELEDCFCPECNETREDELISECLDVVFNSDGCVDCTINKVIETLYKFKELGKLEVKAEMQDFLED
ncbi:MAG TPA: hypothetical protein VIM70_01555 [Clostridium sp.]|uniref:hypothetical protein n=1 Tax=Clostridium sp. TaxID=1506 RepID=UPI002F933836